MNVKIAGKDFEFFNEFNLVLKYDAVASTFSFNVYFDPADPDHRKIFKPLSYQRVEIYDNGELLVTGTTLVGNFAYSSVKQLVNIAGYSVPGVLDNSEIPVFLWPLQDIEVSLKSIAARMLKPFGLKMQISRTCAARMNRTFKTTTADDKQTIKAYLAEKAAQKNIVMSHNEKGEVLFTEADLKQLPVLDLSGGVPGLEWTLKVDGEKMHSSITVVKDADEDDDNGGQITLKNPFVQVYRPTTRTQSSGDNHTLGETARAILSEELKGIQLTGKLSRWDINGKIMRPNRIVRIQAPSLYLYKKTSFFIEQVEFNRNTKESTCTITGFIPEAYNTANPKNIFL